MKKNSLIKATVTLGILMAFSASVVAFSGHGSFGLTGTKSPSVRATEEILGYLPDSDGIALIDVHQFYSSFIYRMVQSNPKGKENITEFEAAARQCGIDPSQIDYLGISWASNPAKNGKTEPVAVVTGGFDQDKLLTALRSQPDKFEVKSEPYGNDTIYVVSPLPSQGKSGDSNKPKVLTNDDIQGSKKPPQENPLSQISLTNQHLALAFLNNKALVVGEKELVQRSLDARSGKTPSLATNKTLNSALQGTDQAASIRFAGVVSETMRKEMQNSLGKGGREAEMLKPFLAVNSTFGTFDFSSGIKLDTTLRTNSNTEAKPIYDQLNGFMMLAKFGLSNSQKPQDKYVTELLNSISIVDKGADVQIVVNIPEALLKAISEARDQKPQ